MNSLWPSWKTKLLFKFFVFIRSFIDGGDVRLKWYYCSSQYYESLSFASVYGYAMHMEHIKCNTFCWVDLNLNLEQIILLTNGATLFPSPSISQHLHDPIIYALRIFCHQFGKLSAMKWDNESNIECDGFFFFFFVQNYDKFWWCIQKSQIIIICLNRLVCVCCACNAHHFHSCELIQFNDSFAGIYNTRWLRIIH